MEIEPDPLNQAAKDNFNINYIFPYQRLVIHNILKSAGVEGFQPDPSEEDDTSPHQIVLLPTGAGKSLCFMLPCILLNGITLVIFPLLSLMSDQLRRTEEAGINAVLLKGGQSRDERNGIFQRCRSREVKMILTNPETALNTDIQKELLTLNIEHLVIDETHTVSEWGDSFRPAYLEIHSILDILKIDLVTAFTATASPHILKRIKNILFPDTTPNIIYGNPDRTNISYSVLKTISPSRTLVETVKKSDKPLIIFASSRTSTEITSRMLRGSIESKEIFFYHAGLSKEEKDKVEKWFFDSDEGILVATCAYGMGVDKSNIRTVIHIDLPSTVESYLQESGRAGRDREPSKAVLIYDFSAQKRLSTIQNSLLKERFSSMIDYAENSDRCRRETLLSLLDSEPEICQGCDVCKDSVQETDNEKRILTVLKKNRRRFTVREAVYCLKGYKTNEIREKSLYLTSAYSVLEDWETDHIREALDCLLTAEKIKIGKGHFWKRLIY